MNRCDRPPDARDLTIRTALVALRQELADPLRTTFAASLMYHAVLMARDLDVPEKDVKALFDVCRQNIGNEYTAPEQRARQLYEDMP